MLSIWSISLLPSFTKDTTLILSRMMLNALPMVMHLGLVYRESFTCLAMLEALVLLVDTCCSVLIETTNYRVVL